MAEALFELRRKTFDTPHFRGIEFIEVESKSILNRVPGSRLPFNWTINPYRGCSHSCSYCHEGSTPVLLADGRQKPIRDLFVGETIYGTTFDGKYRRYVPTEVLAHWQTTKRAYRVTLGDGTQLISSGDHRYLTERGWKHVAPVARPSQRPFLTTNNKLMGVGALAEPPKMDAQVKSKADLRVVAVEDLGIEIPMFDITTGTGDFIANGVVSHNCFARVTHTYMDLDAGRDFETKIFVKVNAPQLLRKELRKKSWRGESVAMGTGTDPYQRAEGKYRLMPPIIDALTEVRNPFSILTKGTLILRDLDRLTHAASVMDVSTAFSVGTVDEEVWRRSEPGTPHPRKRLDAVRRLNEAGVPCGVLVAPILPGISDAKHQIREVVEAALDAGATHVSPILLHLRPVVKDVYMEWLADEYPDLVPMYTQMYRGRSYASSEHRKALTAKVRAAMDDLGRRPRKPRARRRDAWRPAASGSPDTPEAEQLSLI